MDLEKAKAELFDNNYTCVLCRGENVHTSRLRGVKPLVTWYVGKTDFTGFSAADKVVGKATAFLYVLLGVRAVYAAVISRSALQVLTSSGIDAEYGSLVENIINRTGDGICPFEEAVLNIDDANDAYAAVREKMEAMKIDL